MPLLLCLLLNTYQGQGIQSERTQHHHVEVLLSDRRWFRALAGSKPGQWVNANQRCICQTL